MFGVPLNSPAFSDLSAQLRDEEEIYQNMQLGPNGPSEHQEIEYADDDDHDDPQHTVDSLPAAAPRSASQSQEALRPWMPREDNGRGVGGGRLPPMREGEMPMPISPVLTKFSPTCANPASIWATMEHFRNFMLLEFDPLDTESPLQKWYQLVTPATEGSVDGEKTVRYDGFALCCDGSTRFLP